MQEPPNPVLIHPKGWGLYLTRAAYHQPLGELASHAQALRKHRVRNVVLLVEGDDGYVAPPGRLRDVAETYRELASCGILVYSLPGSHDTAAEASRRLAEAAHDLDAIGPVADVEKAFRGHRNATATFLDGLRRFPGWGVTSYPLRRHFPDLAWDLMDSPWATPQIYRTAGSRVQARQALEDYRTRHRVVLPSLAGFDTPSPGGDNGSQLRLDVARVCLDDRGQCDVPGAFVWGKLSPGELRAMNAWAERWNW